MTTHPLEQPETELAWHRLHAAELRRRAAQLRDQAEHAKEHAFRVLESTQARRLRRTQTSEQVELATEQTEFAAEQERSTQELGAYITALRREQEMLRAEAAVQQHWFREQVVSMLDQGWSRQELAEIGIGAGFLAELGLQDHPALRPG